MDQKPIQELGKVAIKKLKTLVCIALQGICIQTRLFTRVNSQSRDGGQEENQQDSLLPLPESLL